MNILMVASEATPFAKTGGLADVLGALPAALAERGEQVAVVLPAYRENHYPQPTREAYRNLWIPIGPGYLVDIQQTAPSRGVTYYFVECPALYDRDGIYGSPAGDFPDNHLRFAVLSMAAIGVARHLFRPDILHLHDWQAALTPVYLREHFQRRSDVSRREDAADHSQPRLSGPFPSGVAARNRARSKAAESGSTGVLRPRQFPQRAASPGATPSAPSAKATRARFKHRNTDLVWTVFCAATALLPGSSTAWITTSGIPSSDPHIAHNYSARDLSGKRACKQALLAEYGLPQDNLDRPLIAIISRFAAQKGFDILADAAARLMQED